MIRIVGIRYGNLLFRQVIMMTDIERWNKQKFVNTVGAKDASDPIGDKEKEMVGIDCNNMDCQNPHCTCDPCECTKENPCECCEDHQAKGP